MPPNDPRFTGRSVAAHIQDVEEDLLLMQADLEKELDEPGANRAEISRRLVEVRRALGDEKASTDPLIDKWEREMADGITPDLYEKG